MSMTIERRTTTPFARPVRELCFGLCLMCLFVALSEPRDDREALAARDGDDFVKGVGSEGDE